MDYKTQAQDLKKMEKIFRRRFESVPQTTVWYKQAENNVILDKNCQKKMA